MGEGHRGGEVLLLLARVLSSVRMGKGPRRAKRHCTLPKPLPCDCSNCTSGCTQNCIFEWSQMELRRSANAWPTKNGRRKDTRLLWRSTACGVWRTPKVYDVSREEAPTATSPDPTCIRHRLVGVVDVVVVPVTNACLRLLRLVGAAGTLFVRVVGGRCLAQG